GPGPAATACASLGETDTHPASDSNASGSQNFAPLRRRPRHCHCPNSVRTPMSSRKAHIHHPQLADAPRCRSPVRRRPQHPAGWLQMQVHRRMR
ncbi:hypothetical protein NDU88_003330, partial [Pleurodeles waltl]